LASDWPGILKRCLLRVSTSQQGRPGLGIEAQRDALIQLAKAEGLDIAKVIRRGRERQGFWRARPAPAAQGSARRGEEIEMRRSLCEARSTEPSVLAYNLTRVMNIVGTRALLAAIRAWVWSPIACRSRTRSCPALASMTQRRPLIVQQEKILRSAASDSIRGEALAAT